MMKREEVLKLLNERYTTKKYDPTKKISQEDLEVLMESLRMCPSSTGLQPWHFFVVGEGEMREKLAEASLFNKPKVQSASHLFVLTSKKELHIDDKETTRMYEVWRNTRKNEEGIKAHKEFLTNWVSHLKNQGLEGVWMEKQTYIALGFLLYTCALLGINSTPIEGFDKAEFDRILELGQKNLTTTAILVAGYADPSEDPLNRVKMRFDRSEVITQF